MGLPNITRLPKSALKLHYNNDAKETIVQVTPRMANLFHYLVENMGAADVYINFYNNNVGDTSNHVFSVVVRNMQSMGYSNIGVAVRHFTKGIAISVTATQEGTDAPVAPATVQVGYYDEN